LRGQYDQAIDVTAQANMENGILVTGNGSYSLVEGCTVYSNVMSNEHEIAWRLVSERCPWRQQCDLQAIGFEQLGEGLSTYGLVHDGRQYRL
jgi:hypothetical protein